LLEYDSKIIEIVKQVLATKVVNNNDELAKVKEYSKILITCT